MLLHLDIEILGMDAYNFFNLCGAIALYAFNVFHFNRKKAILGQRFLRRNKKHNKYLVLLYTLVELAIICYVQYEIGWVFNKFFSSIFNTGANYFGVLFCNPLLVVLVCLLLKIPTGRQLDLIVPGYPLALVFVKFACFSEGCCTGVTCDWGIYNHLVDKVQFPSQLLELFMALLIFIFLMLYRKKAREGTLYPIYLILYSGTRFFTEFTRKEKNVLWILKTYHVLCLMGVILGVVYYIYTCRRYKKVQILKQQLRELLSQIEPLNETTRGNIDYEWRPRILARQIELAQRVEDMEEYNQWAYR